MVGKIAGLPVWPAVVMGYPVPQGDHSGEKKESQRTPFLRIKTKTRYRGIAFVGG